jgi:hypothetical protein
MYWNDPTVRLGHADERIARFVRATARDADRFPTRGGRGRLLALVSRSRPPAVRAPGRASDAPF